MKRVMSAAQLQPRLLVEIRRCANCGARAHRVLLLRSLPQRSSPCVDCGRLCDAWDHAGDLCSDRPLALCLSIAEGRLYIVDPFADELAPATRRERQGAS